MGGAKARRFLSDKYQKQVNSMWECWKDLCLVTTNVATKPMVGNKRMLVWKRLDKFLTLLRQQRTTTYATNFKNAISLLITSIKEAWGEKDITYYLVIFPINIK